MRDRTEPVVNIERPETLARREFLRSIEEKTSKENKSRKKNKDGGDDEDGDYCPSANDDVGTYTCFYPPPSSSVK